MKERYKTPYYNNEKYYDPTAGTALLNIIRRERNDIPVRNAVEKLKYRRDPIRQFAIEYTRQYIAEKGLYTESGKIRTHANAQKVEKTVKFYEACMIADDSDIPSILAYFGWSNDKRVEQLFTGRGNTGKIIKAWKEYTIANT